jgi:hypothetical protein
MRERYAFEGIPLIVDFVERRERRGEGRARAARAGAGAGRR